MVRKIKGRLLVERLEKFGFGHIIQAGDANNTLTEVDDALLVYGVPITANRTVTLVTDAAFAGMSWQVLRETAATGAFTVDVGGLITLDAGEWCDVTYDGTAWTLSAFGALAAPVVATLENPVVTIASDGVFAITGTFTWISIGGALGAVTATVPATGRYMVNYQCHANADNVAAAMDVAMRLTVDGTPVAGSEVRLVRNESVEGLVSQVNSTSGQMALSLTGAEVVEIEVVQLVATGTQQILSNAFGKTKLELVHYG